MELLAKKINIAFIVATVLFTTVAVFGVVGSVEGAILECPRDSGSGVYYDTDTGADCDDGDDGKVSCGDNVIQNSGTESDPHTCCNSESQICNPVNASSLEDLLNDILGYLIFLTGILTVTAIIVGSILYILSGANSAFVSKAKTVIKYALLGFVIALLARGIVSLINILF